MHHILSFFFFINLKIFYTFFYFLAFIPLVLYFYDSIINIYLLHCLLNISGCINWLNFYLWNRVGNICINFCLYFRRFITYSLNLIPSIFSSKEQPVQAFIYNYLVILVFFGNYPEEYRNLSSIVHICIFSSQFKTQG